MFLSKGDVYKSTQKRTHETVFKNDIESKSRRNKRAKIEKFFSPDFIIYIIENELQSYKEAMPNCEASF